MLSLPVDLIALTCAAGPPGVAVHQAEPPGGQRDEFTGLQVVVTARERVVEGGGPAARRVRPLHDGDEGGDVVPGLIASRALPRRGLERGKEVLVAVQHHRVADDVGVVGTADAGEAYVRVR